MSEGKPSRPPSNELREDEDGVPEGVPSSNTRSGGGGILLSKLEMEGSRGGGRDEGEAAES